MSRKRSLSRRQMLQYTGLTASASLLAGCGSQSSENESEGNTSNTASDNGEGTDSEENGSDEGNQSEAESEAEEEGNESGDSSEWADVSEVVFDGYTEAWEGVDPEPIAGEQNPVITLIAGQEYDFTWENMDGMPHNIAIWDANDEPIESTDTIEAEGETQTLTIEASEEMASYVCELHPTTMIGDIQIESESAK